jgi:hypothetical protein
MTWLWTIYFFMEWGHKPSPPPDFSKMKKETSACNSPANSAACKKPLVEKYGSLNDGYADPMLQPLPLNLWTWDFLGI